MVKHSYGDGSYWKGRREFIYYRYLDYFVRSIGYDARTLIDVGTGNTPYLDWFYWIDERVSVDLRHPYQSEHVTGILGNITEIDLPRRYDLCTCLQVLEHVQSPEPFARRLLEIADTVLVSVPFKWPEDANKHHVHDPVDLEKVTQWFGRSPNYHLVVSEPFSRNKGRRLFAIFDVANPNRQFGAQMRKRVRPPAEIVRDGL